VKGLNQWKGILGDEEKGRRAMTNTVTANADEHSRDLSVYLSVYLCGWCI